MPTGIYIRTEKHRKALSNRVFTKIWRKNLSKAHIGQRAWNKGKNYELGSKTANWKGKEVGYRAIHHWIVRRLGKPSTCTNCGLTDLYSRKINWANLSGKYKRDVTDWVRLCVLCHRRLDAGKIRINKQ